jgi:hypothetical protein
MLFEMCPIQSISNGSICSIAFDLRMAVYQSLCGQAHRGFVGRGPKLSGNANAVSSLDWRFEGSNVQAVL